MKLITVHGKNFRRHADSFIQFPSHGVIGLVTDNEGGKSTVLEMITFALFGADGVRKTVKGLRWWRAPAKRQAEVELVFELNGERFRVHRTETNAQVYLGDDSTPIAAGRDVATKYLRERMNMTFDEFCSTYLSPQKDIERIASMKPEERKTFFRKVMGIDSIDRAIKDCRKKKNEIGAQRDGLIVGLGEREPLLAEHTAAEASVRTAHDGVHAAGRVVFARNADDQQASEALAASTARKEAHDVAERRRGEAETQVGVARAEIDRLTSELDDAHSARVELSKREGELQQLPAIRIERDRLLAAKAAASEREAIEQSAAMASHDVAQYGRYVDDCDRAIAAYDQQVFAAFKEEYRALQDRLNAMTAERTRQHAQLLAAADSADSREQKIAKQIRALNAQGPEGACPLCLAELADRFSGVIETLYDEAATLTSEAADFRARAAALDSPSDNELALDAELEELKQKGEEYRQAEKDCTTAKEKRPAWARQHKIAKDRVADCAAKLTTLPHAKPDPERLRTVEAAIDRLEQIDKGLAEVRGRAARINLLQEQRTTAERRFVDAGTHAEQAESAVGAAGFDADSHAFLTTTAAAATAALATAKQEEARAQEQLRGAEEALRKAVQALEAYDARAAQLEALSKDLRVHEAADRRLDAFRTWAAGTIRPEMEELVSGFIYELTDGRHESATITDTFEVVLQEGGIDCEVMSGGAEDIAAMAQRVACSYMSAKRRGQSLSLLMLDEPTASLSEVRRGNVLRFIRQLSSTFEQVLLISHSEETKHAADHVIEIVDDPDAGCCRILASPAPDIAAESRQASAIAGESRQNPAGAAA